MILDQETYEKFGYYPDSLTKWSKNKVMFLCSFCKESGPIRFDSLVNKKTTKCHTCKKRKVLEGTRTGHLIVTENKKKIDGHLYWEVKCDCGVTKFTRASQLKKQVSCSVRCKYNPNYKNYTGLMSSKFFSTLKANAEVRNIKFDVTKEFIYNLILKQNFVCALSGEVLSFGKGNKGTASLDRIDSKKGYTEENVQWLNKHVNMMKKQYKEEFFIEMCHKISKHNRNKV